jgi:hypothetical protein
MSVLARDEDEAFAGAQSALSALLHPWKTAVTLALSRSMRGSTRAPAEARVLLCEKDY